MRKLVMRDVPTCAAILCSVYNNGLWQCRWTRETAEAYLADIVRMPRFVGFVIEEAGEVVGAVYAREKVWWNNCEVYVEELFVHPAYQGKGYGKALVQQIENYVHKKGLAGITLSTNRFAPAADFYRSLGFTSCDHVLYMAKEMK